jgi:hypothetical protein
MLLQTGGLPNSVFGDGNDPGACVAHGPDESRRLAAPEQLGHCDPQARHDVLAIESLGRVKDAWGEQGTVDRDRPRIRGDDPDEPGAGRQVVGDLGPDERRRVAGG